MNLHFNGLEISCVDWALPDWGYMPLFCCNVAVTDGHLPGHRPIEAAVEFSQARSCSFVDGKIIHVGGMGICLREGTSRITVEGNEIGDLGGGGLAAGWPNAAAGYLNAAPPPVSDEYSEYRVANNYIHDCGEELFGAVGILMMPSRRSVVSHNTVQDTAYLGIGLAGGQNPRVPFDGNNLVEYNDVSGAMKTTIDGAGIYVTFAQNNGGTRIVGNLIHDTHGNPNHEKWGDHPPSAGLYLDGDTTGGVYEDNVLFRNPAAGPLIFDYFAPHEFDGQKKNRWTDNIIQEVGNPPSDFLDAVSAYMGVQPSYRPRLLGKPARNCLRYQLNGSDDSDPWSALQFDLPGERNGIFQVMVREGSHDETVRIHPQGLDDSAEYFLRAYDSRIVPARVWGPGKMPMVGRESILDPLELGLITPILGKDLRANGLSVKLGILPRVIWIAYRAPGLAKSFN